jgi:Rod binding domain-containing protein
METSGISNQHLSLDANSLQELVKSKNATATQKNAVVSQQFESVMIKQFLNDALKPMFKGVFNEEGEGHRLYRHFFTDAISESIAQGGGFGISSILQQQLNAQTSSKGDHSEQGQ